MKRLSLSENHTPQLRDYYASPQPGLNAERRRGAAIVRQTFMMQPGIVTISLNMFQVENSSQKVRAIGELDHLKFYLSSAHDSVLRSTPMAYNEQDSYSECDGGAKDLQRTIL